MKIKALLLAVTLVLMSVFAAGCARQEETPGPQSQAPQASANPPDTSPDVLTSASIVDNAADFEKAIGTSGTWIICLVKDVTTDKELVLDGEYTNGKKDDDGKDITQRKIALYAQDENRKVSARYTLTAPKLTINSPEARIQSGTFKGDIYVNVKNFQLVDATVEGNVYFTTDEAMSTFKKDDSSKITGKSELKK